jgi:hypothetical protein
MLKLLELGLSVGEASFEVGLRLSKDTKEIESIRKGFYKFNAPCPDDRLLRIWEAMFAGFKEWVVDSYGNAIAFAAEQLHAARGREARSRFLELVFRIREEYKGPWSRWPPQEKSVPVPPPGFVCVDVYKAFLVEVPISVIPKSGTLTARGTAAVTIRGGKRGS